MKYLFDPTSLTVRKERQLLVPIGAVLQSSPTSLPACPQFALGPQGQISQRSGPLWGAHRNLHRLHFTLGPFCLISLSASPLNVVEAKENSMVTS